MKTSIQEQEGETWKAFKEYWKERPFSHEYSHKNDNDYEIFRAFKVAYEGGQKWIDVKDKLPPLTKHEMSDAVLTLAGIKSEVKYYDYEMNKWTGSTYVTVTHWMPLPKLPKK